MEKELVDIIEDKKFIELTSSERESLQEWCSNEEEFDQLKLVFLGVEQMKTAQVMTPKAETKNSLDAIFAQKHSKIPPVFWYNTVFTVLYPTDKPIQRRPLMQIAAIGLLFLLVYPFVSNNKLIETTPQLAKVEEPAVKEELKVLSTEKDKTIVENLDENITKSPVTRLQESTIEMSPGVEGLTFSSPEPAVASATYSWSTDSRVDAASTLTGAVSDHPDGIFIGSSTNSFSQAASSQPAVFDLLTATF
jgi:hypothetical protein